METILVAGVETLVGANLAACLAGSFRVVGLCSNSEISIAGCEIHVGDSDDQESARHWTDWARPHQIIYCGAAARSTWQHDDLPTPHDVNAARIWPRLASEFDCRLTLISSDAVLTGPWMFHTEESDGFCSSAAARTIRKIEEDTWQLCPDALIVRTNAFGWSPDAADPGWIESTLEALQQGVAGPYDFLRHATPILATDLAAILVQAWFAELEGEYHIAGAERINPGRFVERLADEFDLPAPSSPPFDSLGELPSGFGRGESSLHTGKIRRALDIAMPTIAEGLQKLHEQQHNGSQDRLSAPAVAVHEKVA